MTVTVALRCVFEDVAGREFSMSWNHANSSAPAGAIRMLMQTVVANKDIFAQKPEKLVGAEFVIREVKNVDIS